MNKKLFIAGIFVLSTFFLFSFAQAQYNYQPLEEIPGFGKIADFPGFILAVYKFGIWTVAIAALLMITIGGFMYLTSAGNMSKNDTAKGIIQDALIGLIIAMVAYLILFVINPDLVKIKLDMQAISPGGSTPAAPGVGGSSPAGGGSGNGNCKPVQSGPCSVDKMTGVCNWDPEKASAICQKESSGVEDPQRSEDNCKGGGMFSVGKFQINLTCQIGNADCVKAFNLPPPSGKGCINNSCKIVDRGAYDRCKEYYVKNNTQAACSLYNSKKGWNYWSTNKGSKGCGFSK